LSNLKYYAAAIQTDFQNPPTRREMKVNTTRMLEMIDQVVTGYKPFLPVKLVVFPEFAHAAPVYENLRELREKLGLEDIEIEPDEKFSCDRSLNGTRFNVATGWKAPDWDEMLSGLAGGQHVLQRNPDVVTHSR